MDKTLGQIAYEAVGRLTENSPQWDRIYSVNKAGWEAVAAAVAAAVKEEDARICEGIWDLRDDDRARMHAGKCAAAIRASIKEWK